ncbi:MAG TPA: hypothetical protein DFR83_01780 [Deltaproteobacteria bacterium]|nr:hypothetical protein [Deltaproteobacteria bacterium]
MAPVFVIATFAVILVILVGIAAVVVSCYKKVDQGHALIINKMQAEPTVTFTGGVVIPVIHRCEVMNISMKTLEIDRRGKEGLICKDNIRADIRVSFFVKVNKMQEDVLKVAQSIGCTRASDPKTLEELFVAKFSEALKTVGKRLDFVELYTQRDAFKDQIIDVIGRDLEGYILTDAAIDYLEQTPVELLDKDNILDAQGIRKITDLTAKQNISTNELRQTERKELARQNLEADEAILELEKRRADAEAKQQREIANVRAREKAESDKVAAEEHQKAELARIKSNEEIELSEVNKSRQLEVATKDKERVVAIKTEQVEKERDLEVIARQRQVELMRIEKEKALEVEKKNIADVVRGRIAVEKNVAEEEERIKTLRATAEADRKKEVMVTLAEAEAQESLVKDIKAAEAQEKVAEFAARERLVMANAALEAAEKEAQAKIRLADGQQAEEAASGLAAARVEEAKANALEKTGLAQARVTREQMSAEAEGDEVKGLAEAKVREAKAAVVEREGAAEAEAIKLRALAEAEGKKADAAALEAQGVAEARAVKERMAAEAAGLADKLAAMKAMEGAAREHEEFRIQLDHARTIQLAKVDAQKAIADAQARILGEAFKSADIKIIGGESQFMDRFTNAAMVGQSAEAFMDNSPSAQKVLESVTTGEGMGNLLTNASLAAVLTKLMSGADDSSKDKLAKLLEEAKALGIDGLRS